MKMHVTSHLTDELFSQHPFYKQKRVKLLQVCEFSENRIIVEIVLEDDDDWNL